MEMNKLILYLIPIIVLILIVTFSYVGKTGAFPKVQQAFEGIKSYLPDIETGAKEISGKTPEISEEHNQAIRSLADTIRKMLDSEKENCFAQYQVLPNLGEQGTVIELSDNEMVVRTLGGKQVLTDFSNELSETVHGFIPCVIAGDKEIVSNFDKLFLNEKGWADKKKNLEGEYFSSHFSLVDLIIISYNLEGLNENRISYSANKTFRDFEDYGYLYKPADGIICFFPTVDGNNVCDGSSEDGLDDDCLAGDTEEDISIPNQVSKGTLPTCYGEEIPAVIPVVGGSGSGGGEGSGGAGGSSGSGGSGGVGGGGGSGGI